VFFVKIFVFLVVKKEGKEVEPQSTQRFKIQRAQRIINYWSLRYPVSSIQYPVSSIQYPASALSLSSASSVVELS